VVAPAGKVLAATENPKSTEKPPEGPSPTETAAKTALAAERTKTEEILRMDAASDEFAALQAAQEANRRSKELAQARKVEKAAQDAAEQKAQDLAATQASEQQAKMAAARRYEDFQNAETAQKNARNARLGGRMATLNAEKNVEIARPVWQQSKEEYQKHLADLQSKQDANTKAQQYLTAAIANRSKAEEALKLTQDAATKAEQAAKASADRLKDFLNSK
jgi:hypothetical protein